MTRGVEHGENNDRVLGLDYLIDNSMWKSLRIAPPNISLGMSLRVQPRIILQ
jgi:hypothetical protein